MTTSLFKTSLLLIFLFFSTMLFSQTRGNLNLRNDNWDFVLSDLPIDQLLKAEIKWEKVDLPHTWNDKDIQSGEKVHYGTGWYKRDINIFYNKDHQYFIRFKGVGQHATVYINNEYVGEHLGSYSAFAFNITDFLRNDTNNTILLRVNNELAASYPKDNFLFGIYGGIYRDVEIFVKDDIHFALTDHASSGIYIHPEEVSHQKAILNIQSMLKNDGDRKMPVKLKLSLFEGANTLVAKAAMDTILFPGGMIPVFSKLTINNPHLWNGKKDPFLYRLETELMVEGEVIDEVKENYGIRYFKIDPEKGFILNGEPYRLYGVCRHQEWQDLGNALSPMHHQYDMNLIDEMGATSIRLAHYQQDDLMYYHADRKGILIWAEIPFVNGYKEGADGNALQQMTELIKQNFNHPSIFVWGVHNEVIKGGVVQQAVDLSKKLHTLSKQLDPHRYTVAVSNIWWVHDHPIHELTDLQGFNQYTGWYGGKPEELANWINNYHQAKPDIRFSVSEYGAGGNIYQQSADDISVPDPTGQFFPEGYQTRYHEVTWNAIENSPFIWASYVWNMFDFSVPEWDRGGIKGRNHKGLITYDRKIRKDAFYWYKVNWSTEEMIHLCGKRNFKRSDETIDFKAYSNMGAPELFIDGQSLGMMKASMYDKLFIMEDVKLDPGEYNIEIECAGEQKIYFDKFMLHITPKY